MKFVSRRAALSALLLSMFATSFALAGYYGAEVILWDQPPMDPPELADGFLCDGPNSNAEFGEGYSAEDFRLAVPAKPVELTFYGFYAYSDPQQIDLTYRQFQFRIWSSGDDGFPEKQCYTLNRSAPMKFTETYNSFGEPIYLYQVSLPSVPELAAGTYWIEIAENDPNTTLSWCWMDHDNTMTSSANHLVVNRFSRKESWFPVIGYDSAFQLIGEVGGTSGPVRTRLR